MGSVDCTYTLARQLQIHLDSEKKPFLTPWKWFSNRSKRKDRDSSASSVSNGVSSDISKFGADEEVFKIKLVDSNLSSITPLPNEIDLNEWLASQTIFLFDCINMLYGCLSEFCTFESCPTMAGPANVQYHWFDEKGKKNKLTAAQYIDCVTSYTSSCIRDETIFPTKYGNVFPSNFQQTVKNIHRLVCHILVHMQHAHISHLKSLDLTAHYSTVLYHFLLFNKHFSLANQTDMTLFDGIYEVLNTPSVVAESTESNSPGMLCDDFCSAADGDSSVPLDCSSPAQTVTEKSADVTDRKPKNGAIAVDKYVPIFTIVT